MARKNNFEKTKYKNIMSLVNANGKTEYYANFMLGGVSHQKKNLTKQYNAKTAKTASDVLEKIKSELRDGKDIFNQSGDGKIRDIVLKKIEDRKPKGENSLYKTKLKNFYNKYIDKTIGHLYIKKVKEHHVKTIMKPLSGYAKEYQQNVQILLLKIFDKELRAGNIRINPFYDIPYTKHKRKADFDTRLNEPKIDKVAKRLYATSLEYNPKYRLVLLMSIMLVRRVGELHKLKFKHIKKSDDGDWYILTTEEITKTEITEKYPLPPEIYEMFSNNIFDNENANKPLFDFSYGTIGRHWDKLVENAKIKINKGYKLTTHDNRKLFLSILAAQGVDINLADRCLSHQKSGIMNVYLDVPYETRKKIFEDWWDVLRN